MQVRVRSCSPSPQVALHSPQSPKSLQPPLTTGNKKSLTHQELLNFISHENTEQRYVPYRLLRQKKTRFQALQPTFIM